MAFTLRNKIKESKAWYMKKYGTLYWRWYDEGLPWAIQDYESSVGLEDFTDDDWAAAEENGLNRAQVEYLCSND